MKSAIIDHSCTRIYVTPTVSPNKFDLYLDTPTAAVKIKILEYWKDYIYDFPGLNLMASDTSGSDAWIKLEYSEPHIAQAATDLRFK
jgi:hypothetical protein